MNFVCHSDITISRVLPSSTQPTFYDRDLPFPGAQKAAIAHDLTQIERLDVQPVARQKEMSLRFCSRCTLRPHQIRGRTERGSRAGYFVKSVGANPVVGVDEYESVLGEHTQGDLDLR